MNLQIVLVTKTSKLFLFALCGSFITIATSLVSFPAQAQSVISLKLMAKPNGAQDQCLAVDISKIGINPGANTARVEACRNIQEMRFIKENAGNGWFRYRVQNPAPNGQAQCLAVDGTKIGVLPDAPWMRFEPCRAIQEVNFRPINFNNGWFNLQLQSNSPYCAAVDGTKIGIIANAPNLRAEGCRPIQEHYWSEVLLSGGTATPPPAPQALPEPNFSGNLIRTGGSGNVNTSPPNGMVLLGGGGVNFNGESRQVLPGILAGNQWVYGGIQKAQFCNGPGGYSAKVTGNYITSPGLSLSAVEFKFYSKLDYALNLFGQKVGFPASETWRQLTWGNKNVNYNWMYNSVPVTFFVTPNANISTPVKFSAHILVSGSGITNYVVYDLGGIIDLGIIPYGECRNYSR